MKKGHAKEYTIPLSSQASKAVHKFSKPVLEYVNWELPDVQAGFRKGRETRDQIANIRWIIRKARELLKNIYSGFIDYAKTCDCVEYNKLENS